MTLFVVLLYNAFETQLLFSWLCHTIHSYSVLRLNYVLPCRNKLQHSCSFWIVDALLNEEGHVLLRLVWFYLHVALRLWSIAVFMFSVVIFYYSLLVAICNGLRSIPIINYVYVRSCAHRWIILPLDYRIPVQFRTRRIGLVPILRGC